MANWYCSSAKWSAVTAWSATTAKSVGDLVRQSSGAGTNERVFRCTTSGTTGGTQPSWNTGKGTTTNDNTVVWTEVTGESTYNEGGTPWGAPHGRLVNALAWMAAGDTLYVGSDNADTASTSQTFTSPGTAANPCVILCVDTAVTPPTTLATTGTVSTTGTSNMTFAGFFYVYGISFSCGTTGSPSISFTSTSPWWSALEQCVLKLNTSGGAQRINVGANSGNSDDQLMEFTNSKVEFTNVNQGLVIRCPFIWKSTNSAVQGTIPNILFLTPSTGSTGWVKMLGVDISPIGSSTFADAQQGQIFKYTLVNCKLPASFVATNGNALGQGGTIVEGINCDSANTNYRYFLSTFAGDITHETTIVRTGGASDGTTSFSRKMVTSANAKFISPLQLEYLAFWNESLTSRTVEVEVVTDNVTLTDGDAWVEVEYQGTSGFPQSVFASDRKTNILASNSNQDTSTVSWTTTGLSSPVKQKLSVTFTPTGKGWIVPRVFLAKASTTMYVGPAVLSGSSRQVMSQDGGIINMDAAAAAAEPGVNLIILRAQP